MHEVFYLGDAKSCGRMVAGGICKEYQQPVSTPKNLQSVYVLVFVGRRALCWRCGSESTRTIGIIDHPARACAVFC